MDDLLNDILDNSNSNSSSSSNSNSNSKPLSQNHTKHSESKNTSDVSNFLINPIYVVLIHIIVAVILILIMMFLYFHHKPIIIKNLNIIIQKIEESTKSNSDDTDSNIKLFKEFIKNKYNISDFSVKSVKNNEQVVDFYIRTGLLILLFIILSIIITYSFWNILVAKENNIVYKKIAFLFGLSLITSVPLNLFIIYYSSQYLNVDFLDDVYNSESKLISSQISL